MKGLTTVAIQGIIRRKVAEWLASITDVELRTYLRDKIVVSGGCIASLLRGDRVNDYDIYFTERDAVIRISTYYLKLFAANPPRHLTDKGAVKMYVDTSLSERIRIVIKSVGVASADGDGGTYEYFEASPPADAVDYADKVTQGIAQDTSEQRLGNEIREATEYDPGVPDAGDTAYTDLVEKTVLDSEPPKQTGPGAKEKNRYRPVFISGNAITLSDQIQLCIRFYGTPAEIHSNFDFVHCTNYWKSEVIYDRLAGTLVTNKEALESLLAQKLVYIGSKYPLCSLFRTIKFKGRGWTVSSAVQLKPAYQFAQLDMNDINVWEDQLIGVDTAYYAEIIAMLRKDKEDGKAIDGAYVIALIERMF